MQDSLQIEESESSSVLDEKLAALEQALEDEDLDAAERLLEEACEIDPNVRQMPIFPVMILFLQERFHDALHLINSFPEDHCPELKALCLFMMDDPLWHSMSTALLESPDPLVSQAMSELLEDSASMQEDEPY